MKIESKRLILRNWEDSDVEDIVEGLNNIEIAEWMNDFQVTDYTGRSGQITTLVGEKE